MTDETMNDVIEGELDALRAEVARLTEENNALRQAWRESLVPLSFRVAAALRHPVIRGDA